MFQTDKHPAHIEGLKDFIDNKGEKDVGLGIQLSMTFRPEVLDLFEPKLREALYRPADAISAQKPSEDGEPTNAPVRRFPAIKKISWGNTLVGARVEVFANDLLGDEHLVLADATLDQFKFELMERAVEVRFRLKAHPDAEGVGALYESRTSTIEVTITPPEAARYEQPEKDSRQGDMLASGEAAADEPAKRGRKRKGEAISPTAVTADAAKPSRGGKAKPAPKVSKKKSRASRAFPAALDGTGDRNPFDAAVDAAGGAPVEAQQDDAWPFPGSVPTDTQPPAITGA